MSDETTDTELDIDVDLLAAEPPASEPVVDDVGATVFNRGTPGNVGSLMMAARNSGQGVHAGTPTKAVPESLRKSMDHLTAREERWREANDDRESRGLAPFSDAEFVEKRDARNGSGHKGTGRSKEDLDEQAAIARSGQAVRRKEAAAGIGSRAPLEGKTDITKIEYARVKQGFLDTGLDFIVVAKAAGVTPVVARKAWYQGWSKYPWAPPLEPIVVREWMLARAMQIDPMLQASAEARRKEAETVAKAQQSAAEARAQEAQALKLGRASTIGLLGAIARIQPQVNKFAIQIGADLEKPNKIPIEKRVKMLHELAGATAKLARSVEVLVDAERRHVGDPDAIIGIMGMGVDEARAVLASATAAAQRLSSRVEEEDDLLLDITPVKPVQKAALLLQPAPAKKD